MYTTRLYFLCGILIILPQLRLCRSNLRKERAIDFPMQWRPVQMSPSASGLHMIPGGGGSDGHQHLISITNFDGTNKAQLSQIAHHNAQILRHIKRVPGVPVTQYHNPFPIFGTAIGGGAAGAGGSILSTSGSADSHAQPHHLSHHHHHHPYHSGPGSAAASGGAAPPGPGKHFIVQTSNVIVHPQPVPQAAIVSAITSAPLVHAHPNSLLTSSSNMAQTMVPYGHHHKHQYFSAKHPPAFLLGKPAEVSGGSNGAYKFLNAIHPSTTTTASGAKNYATAALIKSAVSIQPIFSSTTSRIPIIRDSTLTPLNFHRHTTVKPHPVVGKLQTHLAIGNRPKPPPSGPSGPHSLDELSAHQSHLISSLAQFGTPNFVRTAAGGDGQQKLPRPNQGPPFSPLPPIDHIGHYLGKNYANQVRFPSNQQQQQQQQHLQHQQNQFRAQILQQQHHQQQLQHQQQQHQQQQQQQHQAHQQQQQQEQLRQQHQHQLDQQLQQQQQEQHQFQQQQKHQYQQQQQQAAQVAQSNQQQQQSQQEETYYMPPSPNENNHTKPVYEPNQSLEQILRDFDVPFKQMPSFADTQTTRSPNAYLPPSSLPSLSPSHSPSILSPFFQQIHQQKNHELEQAEQHDDRQQQQSHKDIHNDASDGFQPSNPAADLLPHFFISSTFAPSPHVVQIQPTADDFLSHNLSFHHTFPSEAITYHTQHLDIQPHHPQLPPQQQQQHNVPPFTRIEDEFTLNLVPPPSYAKDTSQFRRPQASRGPPSTAFPHLQQQHFNANDAATEHIKALEILNKYNIPAISPLQDTNRFAYNSAIANSNKGHQQKNPPSITSSLAPPTPTIAQFHADSSAAHPTTSLTHFTTEKPNVFRNLNRPAESEYKQHKVMHPSYTGGPKRPTANITNSKPEAVTANPALSPGVATAVTHSFFTIEDAVTLSPQLNHAHRNGAGVRPTANHNQIEASLNRPREEEITEVITMRATSEDDELLQHLDVSSTTRAPMRTKHRRRRPRPSSTSTTERRPEEEANEDEEADELQQHQHNRPNQLEEQGQWETNRFPSNHRETSADPTSSTRPSSTTTSQHMSRHRTRTRGGGRPTVTVLQEGGIVLEKPIRSRRPTQRPDEASPTPSRTRATSQSTTAARTTSTSAETTENYEEPTTMNLRDNIFLANLKQRRRPPHSTKATTFVSSTPSPTLPTDFHQYGGGRGGPPQQQQTTSAGGYVTEIGEDTFMTTRATKPAGTQQTTHIYGQSLSNNDIQSTFDFEEITLASDIAQTVSTQVTIAPIEQQQDVTDIFTTAAALPVAPPSSSSTTTTTTTSTSSNTEPAAPPTNHQTQSTVAAEPPAIEASAAPNHNHRFRHRLRPKDHIKQIAHNEIHASSTADTNSVDEQQQLDDGVTPTKFSVRPVSVRLPIIKTTGSLPIVLDSTTTRTTISVDDSPQQSVNKNLRPTGAIQKFDPKNRPRFSVKEYRQRLSSSTQSTPVSSETSSSSSSTTPTSTTRLRYPTRSRVLPDLRIKPTRSSALSEEPAVAAPVSTTSERNDEPFAATTEDSSRKRFIPKERRNKSTASNEVFSSSERSNSFGLTTPSTTSSRGSTLATTPRTTRTRSPSTSRRAFSSTSTTTASPATVTRTPTIRKFPGSPSLRRPSQPSLRQRIALSQQKKSSTEATMAASTLVSVTAMQPQTPTPSSINKLFNVDESDNGFTPDVDNLSVDDIDMSDSVNTENYKLETAIMKIAKDDHSYRPYAHSNITPRTRSRTSSTSSTTESLFFVNDDDAAENQLSGDVDVDMNGSPSEQSERVADLTRFGTNHFQSVNTAAGSATSRRIPGYFTLATEDPILPIEAFFPKMSNGMRG